MLAYAFDEHPLFRLAFPKAASRSMILQTLFVTVLKDAIRFGRVDVACSHKIVGMLISSEGSAYLPKVFVRLIVCAATAFNRLTCR
jgi:hypothetical protein